MPGNEEVDMDMSPNSKDDKDDVGLCVKVVLFSSLSNAKPWASSAPMTRRFILAGTRM